LFAGGVVTNLTFAELQAAVAGGGTVTFATRGTITFTGTITVDTNTFIDASNVGVTFSGNNAVRLFNVGTGASLTLRSLTLTRGASKGTNGVAGAAGKNDPDRNGGNGKPGTAGESASGGVILNHGTATLIACTVVTNAATGGHGGAGGVGGNGSPDFGDGGDGGNGGDAGTALGGAICNLGLLTLTNCYFSDNEATAGNGGTGGTNGVGRLDSHDGDGGKGGFAWGGALYNAGTAGVYNCTFAFNVATGGNSQKGGASDDSAIGRGGPDGGEARGGAIHNEGTLVIVNSTLASSDANGGNAGDGGDGTWSGGEGGDGGNASGGVFCSNGTASLTNVTIADGSTLGGEAGAGGSGSFSEASGGSKGVKRGGNFANFGKLQLLNTIVGLPFTHDGTVSMENGHGSITDLGYNLSSDNSFNLNGPGSLTKTDPLLATNSNGSILITNNGGPTPTIALRANSPAIDAGDAANSLSTDQRGAARPVGTGPDMGAVEFGASLLRITGRLLEGTNPIPDFEVQADGLLAITDADGVFTFSSLLPGSYTVAPEGAGVGFTPSEYVIILGSSSVTNASFTANPPQIQSSGVNDSRQFQFTVTGLPERNYVVEASTNLADWQAIVTNVTDELAEFDFTDTGTTNTPQRFFRSRTR
jgi:hypothetical protein